MDGMRVAQSAVEVLAPPAGGGARVAQLAAEVLSTPAPGHVRVGQVMVEVLHSLTPPCRFVKLIEVDSNDNFVRQLWP